MSEPQQNPPATSGSPTSSGRRRSSGLMPAFEGLSQQKRGSGDNTARRQSLSDQHAKGGVFTQMFHNTFGRHADK